MRRALAEVATIVATETLSTWHRKLIAQTYDGSGKRGPGRPRTADEIEAWVVRMAEENRDWGYRRIQGAVSNLGHEIARGTIAQILERHGSEPAPERTQKNDLEGVSDAALGTDCGRGFLHRRSVDPTSGLLLIQYLSDGPELEVLPNLQQETQVLLTGREGQGGPN